MPVYFLTLVMTLFAVNHSALQSVVEKASPNALWWVVSSCVENEKGHHPLELCEKVDLKQGYAVLKDRRGKTQFLLIATARVSGIESHEILEEGAPNYWQQAWEARTYVSRRLRKKLPDEDIGLAINSPYGRTQNQLHIHIDCLKPEVIAKLRESEDMPEGQWFDMRFQEPLHSYRALYVDSLKKDPFGLLARQVKDK